ncbi:MAG: hypothetical protein AUJ71_01480 [Candidatus Omnitrophica bacterium CG1_02_49_16]|nr:MAG: hypothetical protein AUJ71_01480 [Candidatus Omnitrophica bacterium CG1_02_49_16]
METVLFYLISLALIVFAIGVVAARSAVYSVLCLVGAMCMMAGLFILLEAFLVAVILILVYAGAILVLFLFVVMLINEKKGKPVSTVSWHALSLRPLIALPIAGIIFWQTFKVINSIPQNRVPVVQGTTEAVGRLLFRNYLLPFELTSFLLLAAIVSVVVLAKKDAS